MADFLGLKNVHVFVTGASGGVGLATSRAFLDQGAFVTLHYNSNSTTLDPLLHEFPDRAFAVQARITDESSPLLVKDMSLEHWNNTINVNLTGSFLAIRHFMQQLEKHNVQDNVAVVMVGSTAGKFGEWYHADYSASKSAMMYGLTLSLKNEIVQICPKGRVNSVAPGWIRTAMAEPALKDQDVVKKAFATSPLNKISEPQDIANAILYLASEKASGNITGHVMDVNAGMEGRIINPL
ncbi:NAD dependent epimerase/dehydratase [Linderina pennispora]|uniref:NAD dependent epimerase/dehydratase n=1 Tax=Linderina pennispora TaxID=61395 RepID=A0A1Y1W3S8_9FUNG|nr:NAD dependent epimerase/dehydratase [Linderina pennispora]ORX68098.1 NAD dependent epimerase/dehydratase [Linderina pennispora]